MEYLQKEIKTIEKLQKLIDVINKGNWKKQRHTPKIALYFRTRNELFIAENLVFRMKQIVVPKNCQRKVIKAAHCLGHLGVTKTKQML